jgi:hypothetical protein
VSPAKSKLFGMHPQHTVAPLALQVKVKARPGGKRFILR